MKRVIYLFFSIVLTVSAMMAQLPPPPSGGPGDNPGDVSDVPIDNDFLIITLALALAFYYFKGKYLFSAKKNNS